MDHNGRTLAVTRAAAVAITLGIGVASFVLSFAALADLAVRAGIPERLAWLWPLIVDGTIVQATMAVIALAGRAGQEANRRYFWRVLWASAAVSVIANGWHAVLPSAAPLSPWLAAAIAVVAPVSLLASTHGLSLLIKVSVPQDEVRVGATVESEFVVPVDISGSVPVADIAPRPAAPPSVVSTEATQPWAEVAEVITSRGVAEHHDVAAVAGVLHLNYEREFSSQAIGRQLGMDQHVVSEIITASGELLSSGAISVERLAV